VDIFAERADEVDLVLLDMTMPRMGGEEAFRELRKLRPRVPVILSSGYNEQDATARFAGKGLAGFIQKPYRPSELLARIREALAGREQAGEDRPQRPGAG
jgi:DNA-binding response OmpR family regulator